MATPTAGLQDSAVKMKKELLDGNAGPVCQKLAEGRVHPRHRECILIDQDALTV
jgi:hypothetical protein